MNIQTEWIKKKRRRFHSTTHTSMQYIHLNVHHKTGLRVMSLLIVIIIGVKLLLVIWFSFFARWSSHLNLVLVVIFFFILLFYFYWIALFQLLCTSSYTQVMTISFCSIYANRNNSDLNQITLILLKPILLINNAGGPTTAKKKIFWISCSESRSYNIVRTRVGHV